LERLRSDLALLHEFARQQRWPNHEVEFFESFLSDFGVGGAE
jgi:hypothetical protein